MYARGLRQIWGVIPAPDLRALGREVARLRHERRLSLDAVAERAEVSRKSVVNVEQAHKVPDLHTLWGIAHGLDVPLSDLIRSLDPPSNG